MEATGYSRWFERQLAALGIALWIGDPAEIKTNCLASITKPKAEVIKRMCRIVRDIRSLVINLFLRRR